MKRNGTSAKRKLHLEDIRLATFREAQLVDVHVRAKGDEPDLDPFWQCGDGLQDGVLASLQLLLYHASVDHEHIDWRCHRLVELRLVLDRGVCTVQLRWHLLQW